MKKLYALCVVIALGPFVKAQSVLTLQPGPSNAYEASIASPFPSGPGGHTTADLVAAAWTASSNPGAWRSLFKFDYTGLPANAIVDSAILSLTANKNSSYGNSGHPTTGTDNGGAILRVTSTWQNTTVDWNTQPSFTTTNAAMLPQSTSDTQSYPRIVVTALVKDQLQFGNNGFVLKLNQESTPYNSLIFHASKSTNAAARPKLQIYYHVPASIVSPVGADDGISISPNPASGFMKVRFANAEAVELQLKDATGRTVLSEKVNGTEATLQLASLAKGMYTLIVVKHAVPVSAHQVMLQ